MTPIRVDEFTRAYITCALWSSVDFDEGDTGRPLADNYGEDDLAPETRSLMIQECAEFQAAHWALIEDHLGRAGHDLWLTRNGHGAGFWDGDWPGEIAQVLTDAAKGMGEVDLYVDPEGQVRALPSAHVVIFTGKPEPEAK